MILTKEVEMRVHGKTVEYYKSLGYDIPMRTASKSIRNQTGREFAYDLGNTFIVKVEDLPRYSQVKILVECDMCKEVINTVSYNNYIATIEKYGSYACKDCGHIKTQRTIEQKYNVKNISQLDSIKEKKKETTLSHYGVEYPSQNPEVRAKAIHTWEENLGVDSPTKSAVVREKVAQSFYKNSTQKCSKQQLYLFELYKINYNCELNFPISYYNADIYIPNGNIVVEYDGGGHKLNMILNQNIEKEFLRKEIIRSNIIKQEGYKQMHVVSINDRLPSDEILFQMLEQAKQYFSDYPEHSWIEYNIDASTVRNAEQKDGVFFDYGKLRKIK